MTQPHDPLAFGEESTKPVHQRPWFVVVAGLAAMAVLGTVIGGTSAQEPSEVAASTTSASASRAPATSSSPVPAPPPSSQAPTPTAAAPTGVDFVMPDVVGMDLQSAQNLVQAHGVFLTVSHDLRGSRNQVLDSNWRVCDQNIPPGQRVTGDMEGEIDFGVVKREEPCP
jgi:hypothetical protein